VLRRTIRVDLPPDRAFHLFTPVGERLWADGWDPHFPAGEHGDGGAVGTVFVTGAHGRTTLWVVTHRTEDSIGYARVTPGHLAGVVDVRLAATGDGAAEAEVGYDLTALTPDAEPERERFAAGYDEFLAEWERAIAAAVAAGRIG
jgi:hypothetical protein